jgi:hypothetical protein
MTAPAIEISSQVPAGALLDRLRAEIEQLAFSADGLQDVVGGLAVRLEGEERSLFVDKIQDLDLLVQRLQGLAGFLHTLQDVVPPDWSIDATSALARLTLGSQAALLGGQPVQPKPQADNGDFFVF